MTKKGILGVTAAAALALLALGPAFADDAQPAADAPAAAKEAAPATTGSTAPAAADEGATDMAPDPAADPSDNTAPPAGDAAKE